MAEIETKYDQALSNLSTKREKVADQKQEKARKLQQEMKVAQEAFEKTVKLMSDAHKIPVMMNEEELKDIDKKIEATNAEKKQKSKETET